MNDTNQQWKNVEPGTWKSDNKGDEIEGILLDKEPRDEIKQLSAKYYLSTDKFSPCLVWGSTILDSRMKYVKIGEKVRITYNGRIKNKRGQDVKLFAVAVAMKNSSSVREPPFLESGQLIEKEKPQIT